MASADMVLCPLHGCNKVPRRALWWKQQDSLEKQIYDLAMEFLCQELRLLSVGHRTELQNKFGIRWQKEGAYVVWQQAWLWLENEHKPEFIRRTFSVNMEFAKSVLDGAYAADIGCSVCLDRLD
ncbi:unnamed protein product [Symbiodinium sp. CCMP2592]|nr:unnamed protein product [Symbiodinium sp. CCMP2592]